MHLAGRGLEDQTLRLSAVGEVQITLSGNHCGNVAKPFLILVHRKAVITYEHVKILGLKLTESDFDLHFL